MKKIINTIVCVCFLALSFTACDLDRYPYDAIETGQAFQTTKDATSFNNGMYAFLRNRLYGIFSYTGDIQADLFNAGIDYGNRMGSNYTWTFTTDDYSLRDIWSSYYNAIANLNNFIDNEGKIVPGNDSEKATLEMYKGEAYFLRAYYFHQLVKRFAKDYEPSTAATDLGVPLTIKSDLNEKPARSTVEAVYKQIVDDIAKSKTLLKTVGTLGSDKITVDCIIALEARIYLDMHQYQKAADAANTLISGNKYPLVSTVDAFRKIWVNDDFAETIFMVYASNPNELTSAANNNFLGYASSTGKYVPDFIPEQWIIDLYGSSDIRKSVYLEQKPCQLGGLDYTLWLFNKFPGNPDLYTGTTTYQHKPKVFRIAEMYLIQAEALAMLGGQDAAALAVLNTLKTKRGLTSLTGLTGTALMNEIKLENVRETIGEGRRLEDLKRWKMEIKRSSPQNLSTVFSTPGDQTISLTKPITDNKVVWGIPTNDITTNPNIIQNPGW